MTAPTATRKPTKAERKAANQAAAAQERKNMAARMKTIGDAFTVEDEDEAMMRAFLSLATHYSENNALLILGQALELGLPVRGLQDVGGCNAFAERGRKVRDDQKNNRLIGVWARITRDNQDADMVKDATDATTGEKRRERYVVRGIYHVSQTEPID